MAVVADLFIYLRGSESGSAILILSKFNISVITRTVVSTLQWKLGYCRFGQVQVHGINVGNEHDWCSGEDRRGVLRCPLEE